MKKNTVGKAQRRATRKKATGLVAFTGHMMDRVGRVRPLFVPRFPKEKEGRVRLAIRAALERLGARVGFCSAACGGDILFIEEMLRRKGRVQVVLPYAEALFVADCVQVAAGAPAHERFQENEGPGWLARYRKLRRSQRMTVLTLGDQRAQDNTMASDGCNRVFLGLGLLRAQAEGAGLSLLALWDGWSGDAPGGACSTVRLARARGVPVVHLPTLVPTRVEDVVQAATPPPGIGSQPARAPGATEPPQELRAVLFADVQGFSELDETRLPEFVTGYLQPLAGFIQAARHGGYGPLDYNTWGDGLFCVFDTMHKAGRFALELQRLVLSGAWRLGAGAAPLQLRIALHAGPVYRIPDPFFPKETYIGTNITLAARMEPATDPGAVFCSAAFAALAAVEGAPGLVATSVGRRKLAKKAGERELYAVQAAPEGPM